MLHHIREYYVNLFKSRDESIVDIDFETLGLKKTRNPPLDDLGSLLTIHELSLVLKKMKSNKTPGIDGITSEFLKVFWGRLKNFVTEAINCGFKKGQLSISMRQCIITCLPKTDKDRTYIKNWRPISLLCVIYKLASGAIAERIKPSLDKIISKCQTGFIKGRQISDSTRLIYDILHLTESKNIPGLLMLTDFEKAFDSLSWKFLYKVMSFFGYSENLIQWIKLFNTEIRAYVLQCGFLSQQIPIKRGCHQGDPISLYLIVLGAEILALLIIYNPKILGILIEDAEFKLTQFADDTTLMLDGRQHSLQAALNTLEIFGSISGLKMNRDKTKIIWIGRKKFSKEKLNVTEKLSWGSSTFTLLGLKFTANLIEVPGINYNSVLQKIQREVKKWKYRYLSPFGKITVIKNSIICKCTHLFFSLPRSNIFLKSVNTILYNFVWEGKPDKIKRSSICKDYFKGGLKMINIYNYEKALKVSWMKRLLINPTSQWYNLFQKYYIKVDYFLIFGEGWCKTFVKKIKNQFWLNVFEDWINLCQIQKREISDSEVLRTCLWYNPDIFKTPTVFPDWYKKGIFLVGDLTDSFGKVLGLDQINLKYNGNFNILNYYTIRQGIQSFIFKNKKVTSPVIYHRPAYPSHLKVLITSKNGCKTFYNSFSSNLTEKPLCETIWQELLLMQYQETELTEKFKQIYKICFKTIDDNELIWFQYRILYKIL